MQRFELFFQFLSALECGDDGGVVRNQEALRDAGRKGKRLFNAVYFEFEPVFFLPEDFHASEGLCPHFHAGEIAGRQRVQLRLNGLDCRLKRGGFGLLFAVTLVAKALNALRVRGAAEL